MNQKGQRKLVKRAWLSPVILAAIMLLLWSEAAGATGDNRRDRSRDATAQEKPQGVAFTLSQEEKKYLLSAAREALSKFKREEEGLRLEFKDVPLALTQPQQRYIIITIFSPGKPLIFTAAKKENLFSSVIEAGAALANTAQAIGYDAKALDDALVKIDVTLKEELVWPYEEESPPLPFELGVDGLYLEDRNQVYFLPPGLAILKGIRSRGAFAEELMLTYHRPPDQWDKEETRLYKFSVLSFMEARPRGEVVTLFRENVLNFQVSRKGLERALQMAAQRLLQFQKPDGSFHLAFDPLTGIFDDSHYGIVPHSGATLALLDLYRAIKKRIYLDAAAHALDYTKNFISPQGEEKFRYIIWDNLVELDSSAMAALSFATYENLTGKKRYHQQLLALGDFLLFMLKEDGSFKTFYKADARALRSPRSWDAPAQSLLALVRINKVSGEERFLEGAKRAARFLIEERERLWGLPGPPPDAYLMMALEELYDLSAQKEYVDYTKRMALGIMDEQYTRANSPYPDYVGGFRGSEPLFTSPAAFRLTGLLAARRLAILSGKPDEDLETAILRTAKFLLTQPYREENTYYLAKPEEARGGFRAGLADGLIHLVTLERCIRGLVGCLEVIKENARR